MEMDKIAAKITNEKRQFLARSELYPHLSRFQDAALTLKGLALNASSKNECDYAKLWEWVLIQIS